MLLAPSAERLCEQNPLLLHTHSHIFRKLRVCGTPAICQGKLCAEAGRMAAQRPSLAVCRGQGVGVPLRGAAVTVPAAGPRGHRPAEARAPPGCAALRRPLPAPGHLRLPASEDVPRCSAILRRVERDVCPFGLKLCHIRVCRSRPFPVLGDHSTGQAGLQHPRSDSVYLICEHI